MIAPRTAILLGLALAGRTGEEVGRGDVHSVIEISSSRAVLFRFRKHAP